MSVCPYCDSTNIEGDDVCTQCGLSLTALHLTTPATHVERRLLRDRVSSLAPRAPFAVSPTTAVRDVLQALVARGVGCVLVVDKSKLVGIFSERDALMKINCRVEELADRPIAEFMTPSPETLAPGDKIAFAVQRMDLGGFRHVPIVTEGGRISGIVSVRDILRYLTDRIAEAGN